MADGSVCLSDGVFRKTFFFLIVFVLCFEEWASSRYRSTSPIKRTGEYLIAGKDGFASTAWCVG